MELKQIDRIIENNIGNPVKIYWVNPEDDWHNFVIARYKENKVTLIGISDGNIEHDGVPFDVSLNDIKSLKSYKKSNFDKIKFLMKNIGYENIQ